MRLRTAATAAPRTATATTICAAGRLRPQKPFFVNGRAADRILKDLRSVVVGLGWTYEAWCSSCDDDSQGRHVGSDDAFVELVAANRRHA